MFWCCCDVVSLWCVPRQRMARSVSWAEGPPLTSTTTNCTSPSREKRFSLAHFATIDEVPFTSDHNIMTDTPQVSVAMYVFHLVYTNPTLIKFCRFKCISKTSIPFWSTFALSVLLWVSVTISLALQFDSVSRCRVTLLPPTQFQDTLQRCRRRRPQRGR